MLSSNEIRSGFLDYFAAHGHEVVASSPLVPGNDPTLLFTNAGMVQFKEVFLGREQRSRRRAASSQRCVRAGGKHNDLENVGYTARHHTFFEMLGNFSFGDYFKQEAIHYAWEFLTHTAKLPPERLWITVFEEDDEAARIWLDDIGVPADRFARIGAKDNFWSMGDTGPCGPCSEIFYDHGPEIFGGPPGSPQEDGDRYIEIWNLVFMQYDRSADGTLTALPKPSVDTGMGLERLAAVLQGVHDNYDTDLFRDLIGHAARLVEADDLQNRSLRVIADHIRSCAFLVADGVLPGNEGRGYVLRRIIRRAVRHGHQLGAEGTFFHRLAAPLEQLMGKAHPILSEQLGHVERVLRQEEERFAQTLELGLQILDRDLESLSGEVIPGDTLFRLYDTYGFPVDLTADIARERGLQVDLAGFEAAMEGQRARARSASQFQAADDIDLGDLPETRFTGYEALEQPAQVIGVFCGEQAVDTAVDGDQVIVVLEESPFYAESGGQVGDHGLITWKDGRLRVSDTRKFGAVIGHIGTVEHGELRAGHRVLASVDADSRARTRLNHSATHLLHAALRQVLGHHVAQKGSLVNGDRLRFDFSHDQPVTAEQLRAIEALVNEQIRANHLVETAVMGMDEAIRSGALALFGEKYGERVRVLRMGDFSVELCGGTHVQRTGDIGLMKIVAESGVAAGVRRIEAVTGSGALEWVCAMEELVRDVGGRLQTAPGDIPQKLEQLQARTRGLEKELDRLKGQAASAAGDDLGGQAVTVGPARVVAARVDVDAKALREMADQLKNKLGSAAVLLAAVNDGKVNLVAGVTKDLMDEVPAGELVNQVAQQVGGKGGGRPDMAMAGGKQPEGLDAALRSVVPWISERLGVTV
ncbi:MAG: alanine--tRNA ligase [Pseudomonadota bacterium]|nr:alanine--tRNA ligase [Pseudomonadota bacterium]